MAYCNSFPNTPTTLDQSSLILSIAEDSGYHSNFSGCVTNNSISNVFNQSTASSADEQNAEHKEVKFLNISDRLPRIWLPLYESSPKIDLTNQKHVDFVYHLGERSRYPLIVKKILSYLSDEDLYHSSKVSKLWRHIILSFPSEEKRLRNYSRKIEFTKENRMNSVKINGYLLYEDCLMKLQTPRNKLMQIQNIQPTSSSSQSPASDKPNFRFEAYQREAHKIKMGKRLFSCPKCKLPSHIDPKTQNTAVCTNAQCRYRFCILCECGEHIYKICDFISTPVVRRQNTSIGTAKSKNNLRRLLL